MPCLSSVADARVNILKKLFINDYFIIYSKELGLKIGKGVLCCVMVITFMFATHCIACSNHIVLQDYCKERKALGCHES